jgi:hypothetical protein
VLPAIYRGGNALRRNVRGLLSDPVNTVNALAASAAADINESMAAPQWENALLGRPYDQAAMRREQDRMAGTFAGVGVISNAEAQQFRDAAASLLRAARREKGGRQEIGFRSMHDAERKRPGPLRESVSWDDGIKNTDEPLGGTAAFTNENDMRAALVEALRYNVGAKTPRVGLVGGSRVLRDHGMPERYANVLEDANLLFAQKTPPRMGELGYITDDDIARALNSSLRSRNGAPLSGYQRLFDYTNLPERGRDVIRKNAEDLAEQLKQQGFDAQVTHSGSAAGPSSYVRVVDPETGRFFTKDVRFSGHSKGAFNNESVINVGSDSDWQSVIQLASKMRAMGPSEMMQMERHAENLMKQGMKRKQAIAEARKKFVP